MDFSGKTFKCSDCSIVFYRRTNLINHLKWKHNTPKKERELCAKCGKSFRDKFNLKRHWSKAHEGEGNCLLCDFRSYEKGLNDHYRIVHGVELDTQCHRFDNEEEFLAWKANVEKETLSRYIKGAVRTNKDGSTVMYFRCHRDGFFRPRGKHKRSLKAIGSNKINSKCPSHIRVCFNNGVDVKYVSTHFGHYLDLERLTLTQEERESIADQISRGVPVNEILDDIRNTISGEGVRRIHLTTRKDINNIISSYGLTKSTKKTTTDFEPPSYSVKIEEPTYQEQSQVIIDEDEIQEVKIEDSSTQNPITYESIDINNGVIIEFTESIQPSSLDNRKALFIDKITKMLQLVENDEEMESVLKHAAPLDSVIKGLKYKKLLKTQKAELDKNQLKNERQSHYTKFDESPLDFIENQEDSIAYEIVIE